MLDICSHGDQAEESGLGLCGPACASFDNRGACAFRVSVGRKRTVVCASRGGDGPFIHVELLADRIAWAAEVTHGGFYKKTGDLRKKLMRAEHSPIRAAFYALEMDAVKAFVVGHFVRHKHGVEWFVLSNRDDKPWAPQEGRVRDRERRISVRAVANAQAMINMARKRLCYQAHADTVNAMRAVRLSVSEADPTLAGFMVPECVYRNGICPEPKACYKGPREVWAEYKDAAFPGGGCNCGKQKREAASMEKPWSPSGPGESGAYEVVYTNTVRHNQFNAETGRWVNDPYEDQHETGAPLSCRRVGRLTAPLFLTIQPFG